MSPIKNIDELQILKDRVKRHCGLTFDGQRHKYFQQKVEDRLKALKLATVADYLHHIILNENNGQEWQRLIDEVTINETYFFREKQQFEVLKSIVLPKIMKQREAIRSVRILSAACANGAEPYSLAILLNNVSKQGKWHIEIEASDINAKNLEVARRGYYSEFDLRCIDDLTRATFFTRQDSHYILAPSVRKCVRFFRMNLLNGLKKQELYQIIFCRNVLYYFDIPTREKVINELAQCLTTDGYLFTAQTEFIGELSIPFIQYREGEVVYYQKKNNF